MPWRRPPDIRRLAVELLAESHPLSSPAVPDLIERLKDGNVLVQVAVLTHIGDFGPLAAEAAPLLEPWLESPNEYLRVLAATAILKRDPSRIELLSRIWDSAESDNPVVRDLV